MDDNTRALLPGERILEKRKSIVRFIRDYIADKGYSPSVAEICKASGITSTGVVNFHLWKLQSLGVLDIVKGHSRTVHLTAKADEYLASTYTPKHSTREDHKRIAKYVRDYVEVHGYSPTFQEISDGCDFKHASKVAYAIPKLVEAGILSMVDGQSRTLRPTAKTDAYIAGD